MIEHRPRSELGGGDHGWLRALHHFAIGGYGNPIHRPIGNLYVWNDDEIAPGAGFPFHPHVVGARLSYALPLDHHAYLVPADGLVNVNGVQVKARDGIALSGEPRVEILALEQSELVLVETR